MVEAEVGLTRVPRRRLRAAAQVASLMRRASSGTSRFRTARAQLEATQMKTFTRWWNTTLASAGTLSAPVTDLCKQLRSGSLIVALLEALEHSPLPSIVRTTTPKNRYEGIANWNNALDFLVVRRQLKLVNISAEDLEQGLVRQVLGLTWTIIRWYELGERTGEHRQHLTTPEELRAWVAAAARDDGGASSAGSVHATPASGVSGGGGASGSSLAASLTSGVVLCSLIHQHRPAALGGATLDELAALESHERLDRALDAAAQLGVPKLLDADDVCEGRVDENSALVYVARLRAAIDDEAVKEKAAAEQAVAELAAQERAAVEQARAQVRADELLRSGAPPSLASAAAAASGASTDGSATRTPHVTRAPSGAASPPPCPYGFVSHSVQCGEIHMFVSHAAPPPMADALAVAATVDGPTASRQRAPRQRARRAYVLVATMMAVVAACALLSYSMYPSAAAWSVDMTSQAEMDEQVGPQASRCPTCLPHPIVEWWTEALLQRMCTCKGRAPLPAY